MTTIQAFALLLASMPLIAVSAEQSHQSVNATMQPLANEPIEVARDVPYADTTNPKQRLDIYLPKQRSTAPLPVILFFHGGGWMHGDRADNVRIIPEFVRSGNYAAVSVGYRLSNEAVWPAQLDDSKAAVRWVHANAKTFGFDANHIGVWGASAGGHLALMLAVTGDKPEFEGKLGANLKVSSRVNAVANFFGVGDLTAKIQTNTHSSTNELSPEELLIGGPLSTNAARAASASPINFVSVNSAPVFTVHGTADDTVPFEQGVKFDAALRKAGGTSYLLPIEGAGHGNFRFAANARTIAFFDKYLRNQSVEINTTPITDWK